MGLNPHAVSFLLGSQANGVSFDRTLTIGRQTVYADERTLARAFAAHRIPLDLAEAQHLLRDADGFAEPLLRLLGAKEVDALDASAYEGCSIVHDLNLPIPHPLARRFSVVVDGGSLEHVFNVPVALTNLMAMADVGGHVIVMSPANGEMGHGFYQFSPELFYRVFTPQNGYEVEQVLLRDQAPGAKWYEAVDPARAGRRVTLAGSGSTYIYVRARRVDAGPILQIPPQQSDYLTAWQEGPRLPDPPSIRSRAARLFDRLARPITRRRTRRWDPQLFREVDLP